MKAPLKLKSQPRYRVYALVVLALLLVLTGEGLALYYNTERLIELLFYLPAGIFLMAMDFLSRYKPNKGLFRTVNIFGAGLVLIFADLGIRLFYGHRVLAWGICVLYVFYFFSILAQLRKRYSEPIEDEEDNIPLQG